MRDKIQFAITCGPRSEPFLKLLLHSIEVTESGDFDLEYLIAINNNAVDIEKIKWQTPSVIIIGEVVSYYRELRECLNTLPSQMAMPMQDLGFDIWQNKTVSA